MILNQALTLLDEAIHRVWTLVSSVGTNRRRCRAAVFLSEKNTIFTPTAWTQISTLRMQQCLFRLNANRFHYIQTADRRSWWMLMACSILLNIDSCQTLSCEKVIRQLRIECNLTRQSQRQLFDCCYLRRQSQGQVSCQSFRHLRSSFWEQQGPCDPFRMAPLIHSWETGPAENDTFALMGI